MNPNQCPDCFAALAGAMRCRCGWVMPASQRAPSSSTATRFCETVGCEGRALDYSKFCANCDVRLRQEKAEARNAERGLLTVEDKREFCRRLSRSFGHAPSFDTWVRAMTQKTVDLVALHAGKDDLKLLERLRDAGAIDPQNKLVPLEQREAIRAARAEARRVERERVEAYLKAQGVVRKDVAA